MSELAQDYEKLWADSNMAPSQGQQATALRLDSAPVDATPSTYETLWKDEQVKPGNAPVEDPMEWFWKTNEPELNYLKQAYQVGDDNVLQGYAGKAVIDGKMDYETAKAQYGKQNTAQMKNPYAGTGKGLVLEGLKYATESIPFLIEGAKGAAAYGASAGSLGLGVGAFTGTPAGMAFMGQAFMSIGAGVGYFKSSADLMGGMLYMELREAGIEHEAARNASVSAGMIMAYIETSQMKMLAGSARKAYIDALKASGWEDRMMTAFGNYTKTVGGQVSEELKQEWVSFVAETTTKYQNLPNYTFPTPQEFIERMVQTAIQATAAGAVFGGVAEVGGMGASIPKLFTKENALEHILDALDAPTPAEQKQQEKVAKAKEKLFQLKADMEVKAELAPKAKPAGTMTEKLLAAKEEAAAKEQGRSEVSKQRNALARKAQKLADKIAEYNDQGKAAPQALLDEYKQLADKRKEFGKLLADVKRDAQEAKYKLALAEIEDTLTHKTLSEKKRAEVELEAQAAREDLRLFKVGEARKTLDARIAETHRAIEDTRTQITQKQGLKKPTKSLEKKLEKLAKEAHDLFSLHSFLDDASISEADLDKMVKQISTKSAKFLVNRATQKMVQFARESALAQRKDIQKFQQNLANLVARSGIKLADRQQFEAVIRKATTPTALAEAAKLLDARIQKLIQDENYKAAKNRVNAALKGIDPKKKGKRLESKFLEAVQNELNLYKEFIADPSKALAEIVDRMGREQEAAAARDAELANKPDIPANMPSLDDRYWIATSTYGYNQFNADQLNRLADEIFTMIKNGRQEKVAAEKAAKEKRLKIIQQARLLMQGDKPATKEQIENNLQASWAAAVKRGIGASTAPWNQLMGMLDQHNNTDLKLSILLDVTESVDSYEKNFDKWANVAIDNMTIDGDGNRMADLLDVLVDKKEHQIGEWTDREGEKHQLTVTGWGDLIDLYLTLQDPELEKGNKFGEWSNYSYRGEIDTLEGVSFQELVENEMSKRPELMRVAQGIRKTYQQYFNRVNKINKDKTGLDLVENPNYSGPASRVNGAGKVIEDTSTTLGFVKSLQERFAIPGSTIARTDNSYSVRRENAVDKLMKHIAQFEHYAAWLDTEQKLRDVFSDEENKRIINAKYGSKMRAQVNAFYQRMVGTRQRQVAGQVDFLDYLRTNAGPMLTGGKLEQIPKQMSGLAVYLQKLSPWELTAGAVDYWLHKSDADAILDTTGFHKTRSANITREIQEGKTRQQFRPTFNARTNDLMKRPSVKSFMRVFPTIEDVATVLNSPPMIGDMLTTRPGNWAMLKSEMAKGKTLEQGLLEAVRFSNQTQSSNLPDQVSNFEETSLGRMYMIFLRQPNQLWQQELTNLKRFASKPTLNNTWTLVKTAAIYRASQFAFAAVGASALLALGNKDEQKEQQAKLLRAAILGQFGGPVIGDAINALATVGTNWFFDNKEKVWAPKFLPFEMLTDGVEMFETIAKMNAPDYKTKTKDYLRITTTASQLAFSLLPRKFGGGLPIPAIMKNVAWWVTPPGEKNDKKTDVTDEVLTRLFYESEDAEDRDE